MRKYCSTRPQTNQSVHNDYFTVRLGNPHKQGENIDLKKIRETTIDGPDLPGNSDNIPCHTSGNKYWDERKALEESVAVAQKNSIEILQATTTVPETLVQPQQADVSELFVDGQETRAESQRAPREIPDTEFRESQDVI